MNALTQDISQSLSPAAFALAGARRAADALASDEYRGPDPYDGLRSPFFGLRAVRGARWLRFAAQQGWRRLPIDLRPLVGIQPSRSAVTLALAAEGHSLLGTATGPEAELHRTEARRLVGEVLEQRSQGWPGFCWGYDFDWETRHASFPAGTPTVVATGFVTNALFQVDRLIGDDRARSACLQAVTFVREGLNRSPGPEGSFCWSYSPLERDQVINANLLGARILVQADAIERNPNALSDAVASVRFAVAHQRADGSWPYSVTDARSWSDNFHTAWVLDCLDEYASRTGEARVITAVRRGWRHYREDFFDGDRPRYYRGALYPIDANACAQSIQTLIRFGDLRQAIMVARWSVANLQLPGGGFGYRVGRYFSNRLEYPRWSTAPMFVALARLAVAAA